MYCILGKHYFMSCEQSKQIIASQVHYKSLLSSGDFLSFLSPPMKSKIIKICIVGRPCSYIGFAIYLYPPHLGKWHSVICTFSAFENTFSLSQCLRSTYKYTRTNLYDAQFGYFEHLQMIFQHEMMCDVMKTMLSKEHKERSSSAILVKNEVFLQNHGLKNNSLMVIWLRWYF
jgi:hypothetical protein